MVNDIYILINYSRILIELFDFCSSYVYNVNGFKRDLSENEQKCGTLLQKINIDERINDFSCKLSNIIKAMLKYVYNLYNLNIIIYIQHLVVIELNN